MSELAEYEPIITEMVKYIPLVVGVIILQALVTKFVSKWLRNLPEDRREVIYKNLRPAIQIETFMTRYIVLPVIVGLLVWVLYMFLARQF